MIKIGKTTITNTSTYTGETDTTITPSQLPNYLGDVVELEEGVTFKRIFDLILINRYIFDIVFGYQKGFYKIGRYLEEYLKDDDDDDPDSIDYIEIYFAIDYWIYINKKIPSEFEWYLGLHGIPKGYSDGDIQTSLMFTPINQWKKYVIKINNDVKIYEHTFNETKFNLIASGKKTMILFDFLGAIFNEICWSGSPEEREKDYKEVNDNFENFKKNGIIRPKFPPDL